MTGPTPKGWLRLTARFDDNADHDGDEFMVPASSVAYVHAIGPKAGQVYIGLPFDGTPDAFACLLEAAPPTVEIGVKESLDEVQSRLAAALGSEPKSLDKIAANVVESEIRATLIFDLLDRLPDDCRAFGDYGKLARCGIATVGQLAANRRSDLFALPGFGKKTMEFADAILATCGLSWAPESRS